MFRTDAVKYALIGLMRDLRGIAMATNRFSHMLFLGSSLSTMVNQSFFFFDRYGQPVLYFLFECLSAAELMGFCLIGCILRICHCS